MRKHKFYKYRQSWSSHISEWETVRLPEGWDAKGYFGDMSQKNSWSEHFHGIEYKPCKPPKKWLEAQISSLRDKANNITKLADDYTQILQGDKK